MPSVMINGVNTFDKGYVKASTKPGLGKIEWDLLKINHNATLE